MSLRPRPTAADAIAMPRKPTALVVFVALAGSLALPATSAAGLVNNLATDACAAKKAEVSKRAFRKRYGKKPMKACVKKTRAEARRAVAEATAECQGELEEYGPDEFYLEWESFSACVEDYAAWIMDGGDFEEEESGEGETGDGEGGEGGEGGEDETGEGGSGGGEV